MTGVGALLLLYINYNTELSQQLTLYKYNTSRMYFNSGIWTGVNAAERSGASERSLPQLLGWAGSAKRGGGVW